MQTIATNKKANHNYLIKEKFETGLVLTGAEVKSLRVNTGSIKESYIMEKGGQLWLTNCYIKKYSSSIEKENNPTRAKKILVNKKELNRIIGSSKKEGMSVVPLLLYFNDKVSTNILSDLEYDLIDEYKPTLNISKNYDVKNANFRKLLKKLRKN